MTEEDLTLHGVLTKIKSQGYWEVVIRPIQFEEERFSLSKCIQKVRESKVTLRGWDYPHISRRNPPQIGGINYWESITDFGANKEIWRIYQSGQFVHYFSCREDWLGEPTPFFGTSKYANIRPGSVLGIIMTLYSLSEIYEFTARLAEKKFFNGTCFISITLHKMKDRRLSYFDSRRFFFGEYVCNIPELKREKNITIEELLGKGSDIALNHTIWVLNRFNWLEPPIEKLKEEQQKFLQGTHT